MELIPIVCSQCGSPLEVPAGVNFVTCAHCHVALAVKREPAQAYTQVIEQIDQRTEKLVEEVAQLRYGQALSECDQAWERERQQYLHHDKRGRSSVPSAPMAVIPVIITFVMAVMLFNGPGPMPFFGIVVILFGLGIAGMIVFKASEYEQAERRYRQRRGSIRVEKFRERKE